MAKVANLVLVGALAAVAIGGCGGQEDSSGQAKKESTVHIGLPVYINSLTKEQYLQQADRICRKSWADLLGYFVKYRRQRAGKDSEAAIFAYAAQEYFLPSAQFWFDDVSYLGAPRGDEEEVEDMLKALQLAVHSAEELRIPSPRVLVAAFSSFNRLAREYGLDACVVRVGSF
jgi:hypothetical protein